MVIDFDYIAFKNLSSFGNNLTTVTFKNGLISISGINGRGKSSIIDALSFNLYGRPYRDIKINELINRVNKSDLWTESQFRNNKDVYKIIRGLKPNILQIFKNGSELDLLSSKKLIQEEIDKIIGINHNLFRQIICIAVNYNKPYLSMTTNEKREVIESIFNVDAFGEMSKEIKKSQGIHKIQSQINTKQLTMMETNIISIKKQIKNFQSAIDNFETDKENEIQAITSEIKKYSDLILKSETKITSLAEELKSIELKDIPELQNKVKTIYDAIASVEHKITDKKELLTLLKSNTNCPVCNTKLSDSHVKEHETNIKKELKDLEAELKTLKHDKSTADKNLKHAEDARDTKVKIDNSIDKETDKIDLLKPELNKLNNRLEIVKAKVQVINFDSVKEDFESQTELYKKLFKEHSDLLKTIRNNDILLNVLSDTGIKSHFFKKLIPILNQRINYYLSKLEVPLSITFNELMEECISTGNFNNVPYMSFSEGEKKRIDLSIQFAFFDTAKTVANWQSNIFFIDELLDSGTDAEGLEKILHILKTMVFENKKLSIYLISHKVQNNMVWDSKLQVEKVGNFSRITDKFDTDIE